MQKNDKNLNLSNTQKTINQRRKNEQVKHYRFEKKLDRQSKR